ncbi:hypothetical protein SAMN05192574_105310 [Mucilaginibacter gossypiicola]|uniref:Uncharacterized protein n=1 Tax=Mucilaginibacter gossypiicola TaxID=551995 RepID=A0A1H8LYT7_9SPHI|nr:hypothetical protein [Mucilaginibacter gossypiicola]SEO10251.1 hypothetical protein SAMN05192574_105310 [Mucilaginibacter gossypiicola]
MWKRIHSNRDPRDTLLSEIKKEFSRYFNFFGMAFRQGAEKHPKVSFAIMIAAMFLSMILSFTLFRQREKPGLPAISKVFAPAADGFDRIIDASSGIRETLALKHLVDSLANKKVLSAKDSQELERSLDRLRAISNHH